MVLLVLAVIWAAALLPPFVRSRLEGSPSESVGRFRRHLRVLESTSPAASSLANAPVLVRSRPGEPPVVMPRTWANEARRLRLMRRRQQVAFVLLATMATTFVLGLIPSLRFLLAVHVLADVAFAGYAVMLVKIREEELRYKAARLAEQQQQEADEQSTLIAADAGSQ